MHASSFVLSFCRVLLGFALVAGSGLFAKDKDKSKVIDDDLIVTGDASVDGSMAITGNLDVSGDNATLGSHVDTYGFGTFYMDSGVDGVRWRLNREAGWVWETEFAGVQHPAMRLDASNRLTLYKDGLVGIYLDPRAPSLTLGDIVLSESSTGALQVNTAFLAANLSGNNTGDQTRTDLQLGITDRVQFGGISIAGQSAGEPVFQVTDSTINATEFFILGDGTHMWGSVDGDTTNLYLDPNGSLRTDGAFIIGSQLQSDDPASGALHVSGGLGVTGDINGGGSVTADSIKSTAFLIRNSGEADVAALGSAADDALVISTRGSDELMTEQVRISGDGNVGLGIADPTYRLDIAGELRVAGPGPSVIKGPVLLLPQGDLPMGEFTEGANPNDL